MTSAEAGDNLLRYSIAVLPFVPVIFRYSRVSWMHIDWKLDPGRQLSLRLQGIPNSRGSL
jgi:hypothetical protein